MKELLKKRLIMVMGKGGVGKSVVSAALARLLLEQGKRVLYVQINAKDKASQYLNIPTAGPDLQHPLPNLFTVNITPEAAMKEYVLMQIRLELVYRLVFENRAVKYFLKVVPALNDLVVLGKIYFHEKETDRQGKPKYDVILVDAQPTGHGLFLLKLPYVMKKAVTGGPVLREASGMLELLKDPKKTGIVLVTLPEEMPVSETLETFYTVRDEFQMPQSAVVVNQVIRSGLTEQEQARLGELLQTTENNSPLAAPLEAARETLAREKAQAPYLQKLREQLPLPSVLLPRLSGMRFGPEELATLSNSLRAAMGSDKP